MKALFNKCITGPLVTLCAVVAMAYVLIGSKGKTPDEYDSYY